MQRFCTSKNTHLSLFYHFFVHRQKLFFISVSNKVIQMGRIINKPWTTYPLTPGCYCTDEPVCVVVQYWLLEFWWSSLRWEETYQNIKHRGGEIKHNASHGRANNYRQILSSLHLPPPSFPFNALRFLGGSVRTRQCPSSWSRHHWSYKLLTLQKRKSGLLGIHWT